MFEFRMADQSQLPEVYRLRYEVYCLEMQYLNPVDYVDGLERDWFDDHAAQFVAVALNSDRRIVGCFRLILANGKGFPCEQHFNLTERAGNREKTVELSRLIVVKDFRRETRQILTGLCREIYRYNIQHKIRWCYAAVDPILLRMVQRMGLPFQQIGESTSYMGDTIPIMLDIERLESELPTRNPQLYQFFQVSGSEEEKT
jgi:N-acyl-L-homoserine lactone synthetase